MDSEQVYIEKIRAATLLLTSGVTADKELYKSTTDFMLSVFAGQISWTTREIAANQLKGK